MNKGNDKAKIEAKEMKLAKEKKKTPKAVLKDQDRKDFMGKKK